MIDEPHPASHYARVLDACLHAAIQHYVQSRGVSIDEIATGFSELCKLRTLTPNVEYNRPGTAVAYAFKYMAIRTSTILMALAELRLTSTVRTVLDLGSGSDATSLALGLWAPENEFRVTTLEPQGAMRDFGTCITCGRSVHRYPLKRSLEDLADGKLRLPSGHFDLVVMSACLQRSMWDWGSRWSRLAAVFEQITNSRSVFLVVEPSAKKGLARHWVGALTERRRIRFSKLKTQRFQADTMPETTRLLQITLGPQVLQSQALTADGRRFLGDRPWPVENCSEPDEIYLGERLEGH